MHVLYFSLGILISKVAVSASSVMRGSSRYLILLFLSFLLALLLLFLLGDVNHPLTLLSARVLSFDVASSSCPSSPTGLRPHIIMHYAEAFSGHPVHLWSYHSSSSGFSSHSSSSSGSSSCRFFSAGFFLDMLVHPQYLAYMAWLKSVLINLLVAIKSS